MPPRARKDTPADTAAEPQDVRGDVAADITATLPWVAVMRDVGTIGKDSRNNDQHFNFRGIDATMNTVGPALRRHGVTVLPVKVDVLESERYETRGGAKMHGMVTRHDWLILGPDGDPMMYPNGTPIIVQTLGQASDAGDKVATKASSVAYRTALLQSLTVPTGDPDPDASSHERAADKPAPPDPRAQGWAAIAKRGAEANMSTPEIRVDYRTRSGHEIDGPEATVETLRAYYDTMLTPPAPTDAAEPASADPEPAADAPPASPPADDAPDVPPAADPRQALWDAIIAEGVRHKWSAAELRADFKVWSADAVDGGPIEIDAPAADAGVLTRYVHVLKGREVNTP